MAGLLVFGERTAWPSATGLAVRLLPPGGSTDHSASLLAGRRLRAAGRLPAGERSQYRRLQDQTRKGSMTPDAVQEWAQIERDSIHPPKPTITDQARVRFLKK